MLELPFFKELSGSKTVLIAGAGGGFDIFAGLPLYFALKSKGIKVHLANLSFSFRHGEITGRYLTKDLVEVTARSRGNEYYFPEGYLTRWFSRKREDASIYCLRPSAPKVLVPSLKQLRQTLDIDTVVLVDGGVDSILKGDEQHIGTPLEDMSTIAAVLQCEFEREYIVCLGFSAERDVSHGHALETIAALIESGAFLGGLSLTNEMPEVQRFIEATEFVFEEMRGYESVICSGVLSALEGKYGDYHRTRRTVGSKLWINPLMQLYWFFRLDGFADHVPYLRKIQDAETLDEVTAIIRAHREVTKPRATPHLLSADDSL